MRFATIAAIIVVALAATVGSAAAYTTKRCRPIYNLSALDGTRYEGADLVGIRAHGVRCRMARRVAYRATMRGLYLGASVLHYWVRVSGYRWRIDRKLYGDIDRYKGYRYPWPGEYRWASWRFR